MVKFPISSIINLEQENFVWMMRVNNQNITVFFYSAMLTKSINLSTLWIMQDTGFD